MKARGVRLPVDPKIPQDIMRNPTMLAEQGSGFMESYGGPVNYIDWAHSPMSDRLTFLAIQDQQLSTQSDIAAFTGLSKADVSRSLSRMERKGWIPEGVVTP